MSAPISPSVPVRRSGRHRGISGNCTTKGLQSITIRNPAERLPSARDNEFSVYFRLNLALPLIRHGHTPSPQALSPWVRAADANDGTGGMAAVNGQVVVAHGHGQLPGACAESALHAPDPDVSAPDARRSLVVSVRVEHDAVTRSSGTTVTSLRCSVHLLSAPGFRAAGWLWAVSGTRSSHRQPNGTGPGSDVSRP
jgi:hypothetical protein